jgi:general secretion pathway protein G
MVSKGERGFTLIEMMIVVAIIAILVSILVPNFIRARAQAQTAACEANIKEIATALELYETDNEKYPASGNATSSNTDLTPYLNQTPVDPVAGPGTPYTFTTSSTNGVESYTIICPGSHDPGTLQSIAPNTTFTHIEYNSNGGFTTASQQG